MGVVVGGVGGVGVMGAGVLGEGVGSQGAPLPPLPLYDTLANIVKWLVIKV